MPKIEPFEKHTIKYDKWFEENKYAYQSEVNAIKAILPKFSNGIEIGVGSGKFAVPLAIKFRCWEGLGLGRPCLSETLQDLVAHCR